ncbi:MAG: alanine--glyoxylate aminotransferase family protein [Bacillota bacterium]|nr:alanine--glyoxylate aminotransferase family protein [Bacillota bacterium]HPZ54075.1 alanine--glyoxylate aminotransferase family protein [Bacillota bacterium]HQD18175.1 alanine--glyoxylate aminotransferase family protein [Bacillota bacterium]
MFREKRELRIPGPTPVPPQALRALSRPLMGHRTEEFSSILMRTTERLKRILGTKADVYTFASSGTGAMEAAVANTVSASDKVIVVVGGKFGERWSELCRAFGAEVEEIVVEPGKAVDPAAVEQALKAAPETRAVFITQNETSTGVEHDVESVARIVRDTDALLIVDAVSSLGAIEMRMDDWGVDIVAAGSQKALMLPPGLAVIGVSEKAWSVIEKCRSPRYYFDLIACRKNMDKETTPFTPAVSMFYALDQTTAMIEEEGLENVYRRHQDMRDMIRAAARATGLELFASDEVASRTITAIRGDSTFDVEKLRKRLATVYNIEVAGGQSELKGVIFRIGHMGYMDRIDMVSTWAAVELALNDLGRPIEIGAGVKAAMEVMSKCEF